LFNGPLGYNWDFNYNRRLEVNKDGIIVRMDGYCRADKYHYENGIYIPSRGFYTKLTKKSDGSFIERDRNGNRVLYSSPDVNGIARILELRDRNKNKMLFKYNIDGQLIQVTDTLGRVINYSYDNRGRLKQVEDFIGRRIMLEYDSDSHLLVVEIAQNGGIINDRSIKSNNQNRYTKYHYSTGYSDVTLNHNLLKVFASNESVNNGQAYKQLEYVIDKSSDDYGKVRKLVYGGTNSTGISAGGTLIYEYGKSIKQVSPSDVASKVVYTVVKDRNENLTEYSFNQYGNILGIREFMNRKIRKGDFMFFENLFEYNLHGELTRHTFPEGNTIEYHYDNKNHDLYQQGNLLQEIRLPDKLRAGDQKLIRTFYAYEPIYNQRRAVNDPRENSIENNLSNSDKLPDRYITLSIFDYQEGQDFEAIASEMDLTVNEIKNLIDSAHIPMNLGDLNSDGSIDRINGNVVKNIYPSPKLPSNSKIKDSEDEHQQIEEIFMYNQFGQLVAKRDPEEYTISYNYYPSNDPDGDGEDIIPDVSSEAGGYLKETIRNTPNDPLLNACVDVAPYFITRHFFYDRVGNTTKDINGRGVSTEYAYNIFNQITKISKAAEVSNSSNIPGNEHKLTSSTDPDVSLTENKKDLHAFRYMEYISYDSNGNMVKREVENHDSNNEDIVGKAISYELKYDILNNLVEEKYHISKKPARSRIVKHRFDCNENKVLVLTPVANLSLTDPYFQPNNMLSYVYDERDLLFSFSRGGIPPAFKELGAHSNIKESNIAACIGNTATIKYRYDGNRNLIETIDMGSNKKSIEKPKTTNFLYDGFDRQISVIDALGNQTLLHYDSADNILCSSIFGNTGEFSPADNNAALFKQPLSLDDIQQPLLSQTQFEFDELNRPIREKHRLFSYSNVENRIDQLPHKIFEDGIWITSRYEYDRKNRLISRIDNEGNVDRFVYNSMDWVCTIFDPEGNEIHYTYDANGNITKMTQIEITNRSGVTSALVPDLKETFTTINVYDSLNRLIRTTDNIGHTSYFEYDSRDNLISISDAQYSQDPADLIADPLGLFPAPGQDSRGANMINLPGNKVQYIYDGLNRRISEIGDLRINGQGKNQIDTSNIHNPDGLIIVDYEWDSNNRLVAVADDGHVDGSHNTSPGIIEGTNPKGNVIRYTYDNNDRIIREIYPDGSIIGYSYGAILSWDEIESIVDANGSRINFIYDSLGRIVEKSSTFSSSTDPHPLGGFKDSNRQWEVVGTRVQRFSYDGLHRLVRATDKDSFSLASDEQTEQTVQFHYDSLDNVIDEIQNGYTISSIYDNINRRIKLKYPNQRTLEFSYDGLQRIKEIRDESSNLPIVRYEYIGPNRVLERTYKNGVKLTYLDLQRGRDIGYDGIKRKVLYRHVRQDGALTAGFRYAYNRAHSIISETKEHYSDQLEDYEYDSTYRLISFHQQNLSQSYWELDGVGNWYVHNDFQNEINKLNEYVLFRNKPYVYDMNGNLIDDGTNMYRYDVYNRLRNVFRKSDGLLISSYKYDALNRRVERIVMNTPDSDDQVIYIYDHWREIEERRIDSTHQYIYGKQLDEVLTLDLTVPRLRYAFPFIEGSASTLFFHDDCRTNVVCLTDINGVVKETYSFNAYGHISALGIDGTPLYDRNIISPYLFGGRRYDSETGFYYFRNRYLDPNQGRFITRDPNGVWSDLRNLGNGYAYVQNRPISFIDPMGLAGCECGSCQGCQPIYASEEELKDTELWCKTNPCYCTVEMGGCWGHSSCTTPTGAPCGSGGGAGGRLPGPGGAIPRGGKAGGIPTGGHFGMGTGGDEPPANDNGRPDNGRPPSYSKPKPRNPWKENDCVDRFGCRRSVTCWGIFSSFVTDCGTGECPYGGCPTPYRTLVWRPWCSYNAFLRKGSAFVLYTAMGHFEFGPVCIDERNGVSMGQ
jgi:RHS repeat-associated protein